MGVGKIFSRGGNSGIFPLKTKKTTLFCCKIQNPGAGQAPPSPFRRSWVRQNSEKLY